MKGKAVSMLAVMLLLLSSCEIGDKPSQEAAPEDPGSTELLVLVDATTGATTKAPSGARYDFQSGLVNREKKTVCRVANEGKKALRIDGIALDGSSGFRLDKVPSMPVQLENKKFIDIDVVFKPKTDGNFTTALVIQSNDAVTPYTVNFSAKGVMVAPLIGLSSEGALCDNGSTLDLGSQSEGSAKVARTFTIRNSGNANLTISGISLTGSSYYSLESLTFPLTVAAGATRDFNVQFDPAKAGGPYQAALAISSNDADNGTFTVNLAASVAVSSSPEIALFAGKKEIANNGTYAYAPQIHGTPMNTLFTIKNQGAASLTISGAVLSDTVNFQLVTNPPSSIEPGKEGTFSVRFRPTAAGSYAANLVLANNDGDGNPFMLNLAGVSASAESEYEMTLDFIHGALPSGSGAVVYACWIEDENGHFLQNVFVCDKLIKGGLTGVAIPMWKTTTYPLDIDAVSGATVTNNLSFTTGLKEVSKKLRVYFEVDHSWNGNTYFYDRPSFIYRSDLIDVANLNVGGYDLSPLGWMSNDSEGTSTGQQPKSAIDGYEQYKLMEGTANLQYIQDSSYMTSTLKATVRKK